MNRCHHTAIGLVALILAGAGCGSNGGAPPSASNPAGAGPNNRLKFKEEYKKMIGKDGKMLWNPSQSSKRPPGIPQK